MKREPVPIELDKPSILHLLGDEARTEELILFLSEGAIQTQPDSGLRHGYYLPRVMCRALPVHIRASAFALLPDGEVSGLRMRHDDGGGGLLWNELI